MNDKRSQSRADELEERLIDFAVRIVKLSANLPRTPAGKHIADRFYGLELHRRRITVSERRGKPR